VRMHASDMEDIQEASAGDIVAMFGIDCATGDTFTDGSVRCARARAGARPCQHSSRPPSAGAVHHGRRAPRPPLSAAPRGRYTMTSMNVPEPVMSLAITPRTREGASNFSKALYRFTREDPTFRARPPRAPGACGRRAPLRAGVRAAGCCSIVGGPGAGACCGPVTNQHTRPVHVHSSQGPGRGCSALCAGAALCPHGASLRMAHAQVSTDGDTGQTIISGMGELHLDIYVERMRREYKARHANFAMQRAGQGGAAPRPRLRRSVPCLQWSPGGTAPPASARAALLRRADHRA